MSLNSTVNYSASRIQCASCSIVFESRVDVKLFFALSHFFFLWLLLKARACSLYFCKKKNVAHTALMQLILFANIIIS